MGTFGPCVLTANDLVAGDVVFLDAAGGWTRRLDSARLFEDGTEAKRCLAAAELQEDAVIDPYLAEVLPGDRHGAQPVRLREAIRAAEPTDDTRRKRNGT